jgi:lipopolysaccharide exporter
MSSQPPPTPPRSIAEKMAKGAGWMVFLRFMVRGTGIISTLILARLLLPDDFGLISLAMSLSEGIEALGALGLQLALIRQPTISRPLYDTAFTITLIRNLLSAAVLAALAPLSADFFNDGRLPVILYVIALVTALQGLENIGIVSFRKEMRFEKEVLIFIVPKLVAFVVTLTLAYILRDYRALLAGIVCQRLARVGLSYIMDSYRPRLSLAAWRELLKFSNWIWLNSIAYFIRERSDAFVLGRLLGPASIGIFRVGAEIASLPSTELVQPISRALFSGFALAENAGAATRQIFVQSLGLVLAIILPVALGLSLCAEPLVLIALGPKWVQTIPIIQIIAGFSVLTVFGELGAMALIAVGKPAASTAMVVIGAAVRLPLIIAGTYYGGLNGLAWAIALSTALDFIVCLTLTVRILEVRFAAFWTQSWRTLAASAIMAAAVPFVLAAAPEIVRPFAVWLESLLSWHEHATTTFVTSLGTLLAAVLTGALVYAAALLGLWRLAGRPPGPETTILAEIKRKLSRPRLGTVPGA